MPLSGLLPWYDDHKRDLPWRGGSPYALWVSEIMLQQTQVAIVIPYFLRFMERFPTIETLASSSLDDVLAQWAGLGYYARARNLHLAARTIVAEHGGEIPRDPADVEALPGIGRYTAGAILSIAFDVRCPLVDANVARVLSRVFGLRGDPKSTANQSALWSLAERLVPVERAGDFNQALMELGALVCRPDDPLCERCPLLRECVAGNSPDPTALPEIPPGRATVSVVHSSAIILRQETQPPRPEPSRPEPKRHRGARIVAPRTPYPTLAHPRTEVLIVQRPPHGLWGGLWEFPRVVCAKGEDPAVAAARAAREVAGLEVTVGSRVGLVKHSVTHHRIALHGYLGRAIGPADAPPAEGSVQRWAPVEEVASYALSAPQVLLRDALERMLAEDAAGAAHPAMEL